MNNELVDITILVVSCDKYSDTWNSFFHLFFKNWPDCPYPIKLVSNYLEYSDNRVGSIKVGKDLDYSSNLIKALSNVETDWVIFWVEDRPPSRQVDTTSLIEIIDLAISKNAAYLKLIPCYPPALVDKENKIGVITKGSRYLVSMTVALWRTEVLLELLKPGETAWDIEKHGGIARAKQSNYDFYALSIDSYSNPPIQDIHLISKGKLMARGIHLLRREGLLDSLSSRKTSSIKHNLYFELYDVFWNLIYQTIWIKMKLIKIIKSNNR